MEISNIKKALRTHRMESRKIDFTDISTFDIVPTPPKGPKPETNKLSRRIRAQKVKVYETKASLCLKDLDTTNDVSVKNTLIDHQIKDSSNELVNANPIRYPAPGPREQLTPSPFPINKNKLAPVVNPKRNAVPKPKQTCPVKPTHKSLYDSDMPTVTELPARTYKPQSLPEPIYNPNPIRYPSPGPRENLAPSPFPVNKNKLAPVVNPKRNAVPKTARVGPRPVKAVHMPVYSDNSDSSCILTQLFSDREDYRPTSAIPVMENSHPIRYSVPGPREQLLPSPFPVNKACLPPLIKHGRVIAPMCG
ncbi:titin-like [Argopecten irradians]|uniref:titin-like n=1 Tax=Argopecten irradians TaxID=31199 RepID=UPI003710F1A6